jgi:hypothetical protein
MVGAPFIESVLSGRSGGTLKDLQRDIGLSGVQLEMNCAGPADHAAEREAIRLLAGEVKSAFR